MTNRYKARAAGSNNLLIRSSRMVDSFTKEQRSKVMGRVGRFNTPPEIAVRKIVHGLGFRFRLHRRDLPGTPDIVLPRHCKAIFVHGCFWHRHGCKKTTTPKSNVDFWREKFARNLERDRVALAELSDRGWESMVVWECETKDEAALRYRLKEFLGD